MGTAADVHKRLRRYDLHVCMTLALSSIMQSLPF
jgi:hypothetical protein